MVKSEKLRGQGTFKYETEDFAIGKCPLDYFKYAETGKNNLFDMSIRADEAKKIRKDVNVELKARQQ